MPQLNTDIQDHIALVTITNPPRGYMNNETVQELIAAQKELDANDDVRVVVFTGGVPGVFIRHYDVGEILVYQEIARKAAAESNTDPAPEPAVQAFYNVIDFWRKPTIAAINGFCQGGGFEFALSCDIRVAQDGDYRIGLPESNIGIFPGAGGTQRLTRHIGVSRALEMILRGRTVGPREAADVGMIHEVAPGSNVLDRAMVIARDLASKTPASLKIIKELIKPAPDRTLAEGLKMEYEGFAALIRDDDDSKQMMEAFLAQGEDINKVRL